VVLKYRTFKSRGAPARPRDGTRWFGGITYQAWHQGYYIYSVNYEFYHHDPVVVNDTVIEADTYVRVGDNTVTLSDDGTRIVDYSRLPTSSIGTVDISIRSVNFVRLGSSTTSSVSDSATRVHDAERVFAEDVFADDGLE